MALGFSGGGRTGGQPGKQEASQNGATQGVPQTDSLDDYGKAAGMSTGTKNMILLAAAVVILLVAGFGVVKMFGQKGSAEDSQGTESQQPDNGNGEHSAEAVYDEYGNLISENGIYTPEGEVISDDAINPGMTDYAESEKNQTTPYVYKDSEFIKDLNGLDVSAVYNVQSRNYVQDYVNYETRRAIMDDGMELYWLEVIYKQKRYRVQVPFYYFKDMGTEGICKVEIEVLTLEGGEKIISYMQVIEDSEG